MGLEYEWFHLGFIWNNGFFRRSDTFARSVENNFLNQSDPGLPQVRISTTDVICGKSRQKQSKGLSINS